MSSEPDRYKPYEPPGQGRFRQTSSTLIVLIIIAIIGYYLFMMHIGLIIFLSLPSL